MSRVTNGDPAPWLNRFDYDPETGLFTFKNSRFATLNGKVAGRQNKFNGYWYLSCDGVERLAHRVAWLHVTGDWPTDEVDHENRNRTDNRWANLRQAVRAGNSANRIRPSRTGVKGAYPFKGGRFWSHVTKDGKQHYLGMFDTVEDAHAAYCAAAEPMHGEFFRATA